MLQEVVAIMIAGKVISVLFSDTIVVILLFESREEERKGPETWAPIATPPTNAFIIVFGDFFCMVSLVRNVCLGNSRCQEDPLIY